MAVIYAIFIVKTRTDVLYLTVMAVRVIKLFDTGTDIYRNGYTETGE